MANKSKTNKRNLKVYGKCVKPYKYNSINPEIRLTGKWVKEWGFNCGNEITVRNIKKGIIILSDFTTTPQEINL